MKREAQDVTSRSASPFVGTWHSSSLDALATALHTSFDRGLSGHEAQQRLQREGPNELPVGGSVDSAMPPHVNFTTDFWRMGSMGDVLY